MNPNTPLARHQRRRLEQVAGLGLCTDVSLAAYLAEIGEPCDRSLLAKQRSGEAPAKLGLLDVIICHTKAPAEVLGLWAREYGCRVESVQAEVHADPLVEALALAAHANQLAQAIVRGAPAEELAKLGELCERRARTTRAAVRRAA